jgi:hypothetical protein
MGLGLGGGLRGSGKLGGRAISTAADFVPRRWSFHRAVIWPPWRTEPLVGISVRAKCCRVASGRKRTGTGRSSSGSEIWGRSYRVRPLGVAYGRRSRRLKTSVRWVRPDHVRASVGDAGP